MSMAKREISLSIEPLLLDQPYKQVVKATSNKSPADDGKTAKAIFLFFRILLTLIIICLTIQLLFRFLPLLLSLIHAAINRLQNYEKQTENFFTNEAPEFVRQFMDFEKRFGRVWSGEKERWERFKVFEKNLKEIERLNAEAIKAKRNVTFGINGMTDKSDEEMRQILLPLDHFKKRRQNAKFIRQLNPILRESFTARSDEELEEYPSHFDWRPKGVVTPVKAQGQCGSCWAFAAVATTESAHAVAHGELISLSEQELLDCNLENNACQGGNEDKAFSFIHERGLVSEWEYPYVAQRQNSCRMNEKSENLTTIDVAVFINPDEDSIIDWLLNFGPVNVGIAVPPDMKPYTGGIYHPSDFDCKFRVLGLHALLVVGYGVSDDGVKYWIVKNSWGDTWGQEHGYVNFIRGINACGIEDEPIGILA